MLLLGGARKESWVGSARQTSFFSRAPGGREYDQAPPSGQLLKWIGNKHRFAAEIVSYFPGEYERYIEPFLGSGAVLGTLAPRSAVASDSLAPLIDLWNALKETPQLLIDWYSERWEESQEDPRGAYEKVKARFNREPNAADLLFLSRSCYGGVIRFRKDGYMSTPVGVHRSISPASMAKRARIWHARIQGTTFVTCDFEEALEKARAGDIVYCDPPYADTQAILYGSQSFALGRLLDAIRRAKGRGAFVALSIDGRKKSGDKVCKIEIPNGLFPRTVYVNCGRSMLRRFQMEGQTLEREVVADRLLLTW